MYDADQPVDYIRTVHYPYTRLLCKGADYLHCDPMELKDFVAESIKQIIDGVTAAQEYAKTFGADVNPHGIQQVWLGRQTNVYKDTEGKRFTQTIEFDVATTAGDESKAGANAGISVIPALFKAGVKGEIAESNSIVSRIKFEVPVFLPTQK